VRFGGWKAYKWSMRREMSDGREEGCFGRLEERAILLSSKRRSDKGPKQVGPPARDLIAQEVIRLKHHQTKTNLRHCLHDVEPD
jgi:hypothetical protein